MKIAQYWTCCAVMLLLIPTAVICQPLPELIDIVNKQYPVDKTNKWQFCISETTNKRRGKFAGQSHLEKLNIATLHLSSVHAEAQGNKLIPRPLLDSSFVCIISEKIDVHNNEANDKRFGVILEDTIFVSRDKFKSLDLLSAVLLYLNYLKREGTKYNKVNQDLFKLKPGAVNVVSDLSLNTYNKNTRKDHEEYIQLKKLAKYLFCLTFDYGLFKMEEKDGTVINCDEFKRTKN